MRWFLYFTLTCFAKANFDYGSFSNDDFLAEIAKIEVRMAQLETKIGTVENENNELKKNMAEMQKGNLQTNWKFTHLEKLYVTLKEESDQMKIKLTSLENEEQVKKYSAYASCQEYYDRKIRDDGVYEIQPSLDVEPFNVTCSFNETSGIGKTMLSHKHSQPVQQTSIFGSTNGCRDAGCFKDTITYEANKNQIEALIGMSTNCYQSIVHNCTMNALTSFSWWTDRFGEKYYYWHGNKNSTAQGCQCADSTTEACSSLHVKNNLCNCDDRDVNNVDRGLLTSSKQLPVMELAYGDSKTRFSWIEYELGSFTCEGKYLMYPSEVTDDDISLKVAYTSGCSEKMVPKCKLEFDNVIYDHGSRGSWKKDRFVVPIDGYYEFDLHLYIQHDGRSIYSSVASIQFKLNLNKGFNSTHYVLDRISENFDLYSKGYPSTITAKSEIYLRRGEEVYYKPEYVHEYNGYHYKLNSSEDCKTATGPLDKSHSCTWLKIRKVASSLQSPHGN